MEVFVVLSTVLVLAVTAPSVSSFDIPLPFRKAMADCVVSNDTMTCLSVKGITAFNRFANSTKIEIFPGISIRRDSTISGRSANAISENEIIETLPSEASARSARLFDLAMDSITKFFNSFSLEVKFPNVLARAIEQGRIIKKKYVDKVALALALKALLLAKYALMNHCKHKGHSGSLVSLVTDTAAQFL